MEFFVFNKAHYHKLISAEDEFYYPLIFQTPLLNARFIGKHAEVKLTGGNGRLSGLLLGVTNETLLSYMKSYFHYSPETLNASALPLQENERTWLESHFRIKKPFTGIRYISKPKQPPFYILLFEKHDIMALCSVAETEMAELPQINYNKIITNEAIEILVSYLKNALPKKLKTRGKTHRHSIDTEIKQLRISKFLRVSDEKIRQ